MTTNLWRNRHDRSNTDKSLNTVQFSVDRGIVGVDWDVEVSPNESLSWGEYEERATEAGFTDKDSWVRSLTAIHEHMNENDLCYTRDASGHFYLGRVTGPWRYETGSEYEKHELVNVRDCDWYRVWDPEETVPTELLESFERGAVLQRIKDPRVLAFSQRLFELMDDRVNYDIDLPYTMDNWLSDDDLKDLLSLYLQADDNQVLLPSTVDQTPFLPDGITVNRLSADRTLYQIQHRRDSLPPGAYTEDDRRVVYLQRGDKPLPDLPDHVEVVSLEELTAIFEDHWDLLPRRIRIIGDTLRKRGSLSWTRTDTSEEHPGTDEEDSSRKPAAVSGRNVLYLVAGFLLGLALMSSYGYWTTSPMERLRQEQRVAVKAELRELRSSNKSLKAERNELKKTLAGIKEADDSRKEATPSAESNWVNVRIRQNDTLSELLQRFQGSQAQQDVVVERNNISNRDLIFTGSTLSFPSQATVENERMAQNEQ